MRLLFTTVPLLAAVVAAAVLHDSGSAEACAGLIGSNGAVNLGRTTTLAAYHDGVEHYVTAFQFQGGGEFGTLIPLPGVPTKVERGGGRARPADRRRNAGAHHDPDLEPVGAAANPRPGQAGGGPDRRGCLSSDRRQAGPAAPAGRKDGAHAQPGGLRESTDRPALGSEQRVGAAISLADEAGDRQPHQRSEVRSGR